MIERIISGGQNGVDQAGLRAARAVGIATGGWALHGWTTIDAPAPWLAGNSERTAPGIGASAEALLRSLIMEIR